MVEIHTHFILYFILSLIQKNQKMIYSDYLILVPHVGFFRGSMQEMFV